MRSRVRTAQSRHDQVIEAVASAQKKHDPYTNPGQEHNWSIRVDGEEVYPDVLLCNPGTKTVAHLIEVETEDSVNDAEAVQWATYSRGPGTFWLMVPHHKLAEAQRICRRYGIAALFGRWWINNGRIQFQWS